MSKENGGQNLRSTGKVGKVLNDDIINMSDIIVIAKNFLKPSKN
jgi:hypothetical protein